MSLVTPLHSRSPASSHHPAFVLLSTTVQQHTRYPTQAHPRTMPRRFDSLRSLKSARRIHAQSRNQCLQLPNPSRHPSERDEKSTNHAEHPSRKLIGHSLQFQTLQRIERFSDLPEGSVSQLRTAAPLQTDDLEYSTGSSSSSSSSPTAQARVHRVRMWTSADPLCIWMLPPRFLNSSSLPRCGS
ncbi:hypothetical protein CC80DRAFT_211305 [Byssothecium circinans]|uniref:Uncharacterized protein n=1 Tax=Byssothecium circinans TaxID=147558 RepID=A0A6A5TFN7_9PLEO|nr:hypothetical protein CC80DRAFT_211305 [Byssothecium circinans]